MERAFLGRGWAFPVTIGPRGDVATAEAEEDIRQSVRLILETQRCERPMRPEFGAGLAEFAFAPISTANDAQQVLHRRARWRW